MPQVRRSGAADFGTSRVRLPPTAPRQRIGLLGGSFNPPHAAHVLISRIALARLGLDQLWWVVTPGNPLKSKSDLAALEERLAACRALVGDRRIRVTGFEADLPTTFTTATLAFLRRRRPDTRFVWIMGADNLKGFHHWQQWQRIGTLMPIAVVDRPGQRYAALAGRAAQSIARERIPEAQARKLTSGQARRTPCWALLGGPLSALSSSAIRRQRQQRG
jgi:nicotinate-nucleotide adenylyltransferase